MNNKHWMKRTSLQKRHGGCQVDHINPWSDISGQLTPTGAKERLAARFSQVCRYFFLTGASHPSPTSHNGSRNREKNGWSFMRKDSVWTKILIWQPPHQKLEKTEHTCSLKPNIVTGLPMLCGGPSKYCLIVWKNLVFSLFVVGFAIFVGVLVFFPVFLRISRILQRYPPDYLSFKISENSFFSFKAVVKWYTLNLIQIFWKTEQMTKQVSFSISLCPLKDY